ncbi:MAG: GDYXXLXY domain-containing protein [Paenibacillaceae bacterium]
MLQPNLIRTGFLLGISLLLAAIIYFFAANWAGMERIEKVALSAGLVALFYGVAFLLTKFRFMHGTHTFLARLFLIGGCIAFGVGVALLGQIYNSHADSFGLFLIWSIPAILFAVITRYTPFYLLSFILVHLTLLLYFYPSFDQIQYSLGTKIGIYALFAALNLILFIIIERGWLHSTTLKIFSFIVLHIALLALSNSFSLDTYGIWLNPLTIAAIAAGFYYFIKIRTDKLFLTLNALAASAYAVLKFVELAESYYSVIFFIYGLVFVALLLTGNLLFFRFLKGLPSEDEENDEVKDGKSSVIAGKIVSTVVIIIGVIIGSISLSGIVFMASLDTDPENVLFVLSLLFVLPMLFLPRINSVVRYTILMIGNISGIVAILWLDEHLLSLIYLILSIVGWMRLEGHIQRLFTYTIVNIIMMIVMVQMINFDSTNSWTYILLAMTILNAIIYGLHLLLTDGALKQQLRESSLYAGLFFLLLLTFMEDIFPYSYVLFNVINFVLVTWLVFHFIRREKALDISLTLIFWFVFLAYKYYDLLWTLLHKSITLAILGLIAITVTYAFARRYKDQDNAEEFTGFQLYKQGLLILIVIVLQFGFLGYQTASSERLLTTGTIVKLELQPIDPRSLLQGDYVRLRYTISDLPDNVSEELYDQKSRMEIVLAKNDQGLHVFNRVYTDGETLGPDEIVINGKKESYSWNQINYGIENYFIPEGSGLEVERNARFAYVRIGSNGNAMLERLSEK